MKTGLFLLLGLPVLLAQVLDFDNYDYNTETISAQQAAVLGNEQEEVLLTEPAEPGPVDCHEEQYICTRLYSVHQPCKQCLNSMCFYSMRRVYVINKEICVRTVCAHDELLKADLCKDQFSRCPVAASTGQCGTMGGSCGKSCGGC